MGTPARLAAVALTVAALAGGVPAWSGVMSSLRADEAPALVAPPAPAPHPAPDGGAAILPPQPLDPAHPAGGNGANGAGANAAATAAKPDGIDEALWTKIAHGEFPTLIYLGRRGALAHFQVAAQDDAGHWHFRNFYTAANQVIGEPVTLLDNGAQVFVNFSSGYLFSGFETPVMRGKEVIRPDGVTIAPRETKGTPLFLPNVGPPDPVMAAAVERHRQAIQAQMDYLFEKCHHPDADLRTSALMVLCRYLPDSEPTFQKLLTDDDVTVRTHTLLVLCATGQDFGWTWLPKALKDTDPKMRAMALFLVTEFQRGNQQWVLDTLCADQDPRLRTLAVYALIPQPGTDKLYTLRKCLEDPSPTVVVAAIRALAEAGDAKSADGIGKKIFDGNPAVRLAAVEAVPTWPTEDNVERVLAALGDHEETVRQEAATSLRRMTGLDAGLDVAQNPANPDYVHRLQALNEHWMQNKGKIALSTPDGRIGRCMLMKTVPGHVASLALTADGKWLAVGGTFVITRINLENGEESTVNTATIAQQIAFSPDGGRLYFRARGPQSEDLHAVDFAAPEQAVTFSDPHPDAEPLPGWRDFALAADGKTLYGLQADGRRVVAFDTVTGKGDSILFSARKTDCDQVGIVGRNGPRFRAGELVVFGGTAAASWTIEGRRTAQWNAATWALVDGVPAPLTRAADGTLTAQFPSARPGGTPTPVDVTASQAFFCAGPLVLQRVDVPNLLLPPQDLIDQLGLTKLMNVKLNPVHSELRLLASAGGVTLGEYPLAGSVTAMTATPDGRCVAFCAGGKVYVYQR
ncbi:MAG: HEAT repeat domain-containing protein [Planctomycetota bacterium]